MRRLVKNLKLSYTNVFSIIFVVLISGIGIVPFDKILFNAATISMIREKNIIGVIDHIDAQYKDMGRYVSAEAFFINLNGLMANLMGQRELNDRVKLINGHLTNLVNPVDSTEDWEGIKALYSYLEARDKEFLFVQTPGQVAKYKELLPKGYEDYTNQNADGLIDRLKEEGIPVLDLRESVREQGLIQEDAFFVTDHHWRPVTGFWAYGLIVDYFESAGIIPGVDVFYTSIDSFNTETYNDIFLGSHGRRTGKYYAGTDDLEVITPAFETHIRFSAPNWGVEAEGSFEEAALDFKALKKDYFNANPYGLYGHSDKDYKRYLNENAPVDKKILMIGDSFSNVPFTFLPLVFRECEELDMRYFTRSFYEYISEYNPDIVVLLINPDGLGTDNTRGYIISTEEY